MTSITSPRELEEEMVLQRKQEGIFPFTAAAWACWGSQYGQQLTWKAAQEITLHKPCSFEQADYRSPPENASTAACGRGKETSHFLMRYSDAFPKAFSVGTAGLWALASSHCSGCSILLWTLHSGLDHKNHVSGPQKRICCTAYCFSTRTETSKLFQ